MSLIAISRISIPNNLNVLTTFIFRYWSAKIELNQYSSDADNNLFVSLCHRCHPELGHTRQIKVPVIMAFNNNNDNNPHVHFLQSFSSSYLYYHDMLYGVKERLCE